jgi:hypothetical protein
MKNTFVILLFLFTVSCKSQTYPLRTYTNVPDNSYLKDIPNELNDYVGTWNSSWNNKTIQLTISKEVNKYNSGLDVYIDCLVMKFKVTDLNGNVLFDNLSLTNNDAKIKGLNFKNGSDKYVFSYVDADLCMRSGYISIIFTNAAKTQINWKFSESENWIDSDCFYYNYPVSQRPDPLPKTAIFTKQ